MHKLSCNRAITGFGALAVALAAHAACAQDAAPAAAPAAPAGGIEEIVVRAQRVEQSLQKVPVAVTAVSAKELGSRGLHDLPQITLAVPSLQTTTDNAFTLRGVGSQIYSSNVDSSVGVMVDEVSLGVPVFMSNGAFVDIQQVEVLTGPQGLLFGRNASAGLINTVTKRPELNRIGGEATVEYDGRDAPGGHFGIVATGVLNVPTSSNSALRINVLESVQDPVAKVITDRTGNQDFDQRRTMAKAKWLWEPTSDLSVYVLGDYSRERGIGGIWENTWRTVGAGGNDAKNALLDGITPSATNLYKSVTGADFRNVDTGGVTLNISDRLSSAATLSNIAAWRTYTTDYNLDSGNSAESGLPVNGGHQVYNQFSDELRLAYKEGRFDGQMGLYAFASEIDGTGQADGTAGTANQHFIYGTNAYHLSSRSLAAYGQANYQLTDAWRVLAGARVTGDHVYVDAHNNNYTDQYGNPCANEPTGPGGACLPQVKPFGPYGQNYIDSGNHTNFSYKLGTQYTVMPGTMLYVTWSTGYKGPAMQTNLSYAGQSPYLKPETVTDLEGGVKAMLFDRKLRFNLAGFLEKFTNFQTQSFAVIDGSQVSVIGNAEGVKAVGAELDTSLRVTRALTVNYNATFEHSYFTNYSTDPCYVNQATSGCSTSQAFFQGAGLNTATSAHYTGTVDAVYAWLLGEDKIELDGNWYHRSSINFTTAAAPYANEGAIDVFGASLTWRGHNGLTASVFCKNCTNNLFPEYIASDALDAARHILSTYNRWGYNSVRTIGVSLGYKF